MNLTRGRHVLVADDDPDSVDLIGTALLEQGFRVSTVATGEQAVQATLQYQPDLVLLDLDMPGMDGMEAALALKREETTRHIPVIFVTASTLLEDKLRALREGANDFITKPFHRDELLARVNVAIRLKVLQDTLRQRNQMLAELAIIDELTGLYNRRHLMQRFAEEALRARRYQFPLSCLMLDLDRFKQVNDTYGHLAGDEVLRQFGYILRNSVRSVDIVGRYGGEEFTIILPQTTIQGAHVLAERIRRRVEEYDFDIGTRCLHCTTSIGVAAAPEGRLADTEWLISQADQALYRAKNAGRNRVALADQEHHGQRCFET